MRKIILTIAILMAFGLSYSQNSLPKGSSQLNLGVGISGWGVPVYIGMDFGVSNDITLGGELSFRSYRERWQSNRYRHSIIGISGNANYHFNRVLNIPDNFDFYAGLNLGFYVWSSPENYGGNNTRALDLAAR
jgi:outer membrane immunogenic protein